MLFHENVYQFLMVPNGSHIFGHSLLQMTSAKMPLSQKRALVIATD